MVEFFKKIGIGIIFIYFALTSFIAIPVYTWNEIKESDSFLYYITLAPIVGSVKALAWPYDLGKKYNLFGNRKVNYNPLKPYQDSSRKQLKKDNVTRYVLATKLLIQHNQEIMDKAMKITQGTLTKSFEQAQKDVNKSSLKELKNEFKKLLQKNSSLLSQAKKALKKNDYDIMEEVHPGFGDIQDKLINAVEIYQDAIKNEEILSKAQTTKMTSGDDILLDVQNWMQDNQKTLQTAMDRVYK